ncbi:MAG TPA: sugar-binding protein [Limnochordia bacterium]|nr:sugar-binding protein [Limnochordia bacterium]
MSQRKAFLPLRFGVLVLVLIAALAVSPVALAQTRVFAVVPKSLDNPFFADVEAGAAVAARELGVELQFVGPPTHDIAGQIAVLESLIESGVDGIAVSPTDAASVSPVIRRAIEAGIPVITFDSDALPDSGRIAFVGTDNYAGGVAAGEAFIRALPRGKYAILTGGLGAANLNARIDGFRDVLAKFPGAYEEIPGSPFPSDDDIQRAVQIVEDLITANPDLDGIFMSGGWAQFAGEAYAQALGARANDVKTETKDGSLVIVAFDILEAQLQLIKNGLSTANVSQRPYDMGYQSMYILNRLANGETLEQEFFDTGVAIVTEANVDEYLN